MAAFSHAGMILGWQEHLSSDEMPPRWMWELEEDLQRHFEELADARRSGRDFTPESAGSMMKNAYAEGRGRAATE